MKGSVVRLVSLVPLVLGFCIVTTTYADHENETKFTGIVESLPGTPGLIGDWRVGGHTVHVTSATRIEQEDGRVAVGATVKVEGTTRSDSSVDAKEIEVRSGAGHGDDDDDDGEGPEFKGTIQSLPGTPGFIGDWRVGGRTIHVSASTRIETEDGPVAVGAFVEIKGVVRADGSMDAVKIEVKSNAGDDGRDELKGAIESLPAGPGFVGDWRVSGRTVHVTATTILDQEHGAFVVGAIVEVKGTMRADGSIDATRIEVQRGSSGSPGEGQSANLKGTIRSLPGGSSLIGDWSVNDIAVHVTSSTKLKTEHGSFGVGVRVKVKGLRLSDGSIVATKIQVRD